MIVLGRLIIDGLDITLVHPSICYAIGRAVATAVIALLIEEVILWLHALLKLI